MCSMTYITDLRCELVTYEFSIVVFVVKHFL